MWQLPQPKTKEEIRVALRSREPVERHAGNVALSQPPFADLAAELAEATDPRLRLGALTAIRRSGRADAIEFCGRFLRDDNESVRHAAVVWVGQEQLTELRADLDRTLSVAVPNKRLLEASLGTMSVLQPEFVELCRTVKAPSTMNALPTTLPDSVTHSLLRNAMWSAELRARVLPWVEDATRKETSLLLLDLTNSERAPLNIESLRRLTEAKLPNIDEQLVAIALDAKRSVQVRCEAVATLARRGSGSADLLPLLSEGNESLAIEAIDAVRGLLEQPTIKRTLQKTADGQLGGKLSRVQAEARFVLQSLDESRPTDLAGWQQVLANGGNAARGARRFFSQQTTCSSCHAIHGFGGAVGPDLSNVAQSLDRPLIIRSLISPSAYFGPEGQLHSLATERWPSSFGKVTEHRQR